jgi:hypothetical protein
MPRNTPLAGEPPRVARGLAVRHGGGGDDSGGDGSSSSGGGAGRGAHHGGDRRGEEAQAVRPSASRRGVRAEARLDGVLGVRHEADDVAAGVREPAMSSSEPLGFTPR